MLAVYFGKDETGEVYFLESEGGDQPATPRINGETKTDARIIQLPDNNNNPVWVYFDDGISLEEAKLLFVLWLRSR